MFELGFTALLLVIGVYFGSRAQKKHARIVMLVGGRITMYETMLERARREALLRLLEEADAAGAQEVHNIRFQFSRVGSSSQQAQIGGGAELLAYGTAIKR